MSVQLVSAHQGSDHAANNSCVGVRVATSLNGSTDAFFVKAFITIMLLHIRLMPEQEVERQDETPFDPADLL